jgi:hypothetical protein
MTYLKQKNILKDISNTNAKLEIRHYSNYFIYKKSFNDFNDIYDYSLLLKILKLQPFQMIQHANQIKRKQIQISSRNKWPLLLFIKWYFDITYTFMFLSYFNLSLISYFHKIVAFTSFAILWILVWSRLFWVVIFYCNLLVK